MLLTMLDISIEESQTAVLETVDSFSSSLLPKVIEHIDPKAVKGDLKKKGPTSSSVHKFAKNKKTAYAFRGTGALTRRKITKLKESTNPKELKSTPSALYDFSKQWRSPSGMLVGMEISISHIRIEWNSILHSIPKFRKECTLTRPRKHWLTTQRAYLGESRECIWSSCKVRMVDNS